MQYGDRRWPEIPGQADKVVVLPLGSMEQHGHHLPLLTDTIICQEIVRRAEAEIGELTIPIGSDHVANATPRDDVSPFSSV